MKNGKKLLRDCRGEMSYISAIVGMTVLLLFVVLVLNVFSILTLRQDMQYVTDRVLERLAADGADTEAETYFENACREVGIDPDTASFSLEGTDYLEGTDCVQYGSSICFRMTCTTSFTGGGSLFSDFQVQVQGSRLSEYYYK